MQSVAETTYGALEGVPDAQAQRYNEALTAFRGRYGPGVVWLVRAPGRVNLIGEHTDYSQGYVLPVALDRDILLLARPRSDARVQVANLEAAYSIRAFAIAPSIAPRPVGDWANYLQGPAELLARETGRALRGIDALVCGRAPWGVPRGAGVSSSSALTVAATLALAHLNELPLYGAPLADACSRAEWYVGTRGGIMDHFAAILSRRDQALFVDCRAGESGYPVEHVPLPEGHVLVVMDSGERHSNTGPLFNQRVAEVRLGVRLLQSRYPWITHLRDVENMPWDEYADLLPERMQAAELERRGISLEALLEGGVAPQTDVFEVRRRCRHVVSENARVLAAVQALREGELARFGELMTASHASARNDYGISTPRLDALVAMACQQPGVVGARLTGAGWGGCAVALASAEVAGRLVARVTAMALEWGGPPIQAFVCRPGAGASVLGSVIV